MSVFPSKVNYATGDILTATDMNEIGQAINLLDGAQFAAGKNKIINGDFSINQRAFTSTTTNGVFTFDRFSTNAIDGTSTFTAQTFTLGSEPVAGYSSTNYMRLQSSGQTLTTALTSLAQKVENVGTFAGQTVTMSFYAKASAGTPNIAGFAAQNFGSGGSTTVNTGTTKKAITTSWARYSFTISIPSITGKTVGTGNHIRFDAAISAGTDRNAYTDSLGIQSVTVDIWGVQVEAAQTASPFQTATGTIQGELAACQRYYIRKTGVGAYSTPSFGHTSSTTTIETMDFLPVEMRIVPTAVDFGGSWQFVGMSASIGVTASSFTINTARSIKQVVSLDATVTATTANVVGKLRANNDAAAYIGYSSEL
jgi:hypothetical protein